MARATIDFGIDLGTTNTTIAVMDGAGAKVIPNKRGAVITPSAVWIDKRGELHVGEEAKQRPALLHKTEAPNATSEFKQLMGQGKESAKTFPRSGRVLTPEEMSAEVLKSVRTDVRTSLGEDVTAAVITVPAAFSQPATAATKRAAELAGITVCPLLLEPVAASVAYGFQTERENVYWLVYDFGGGTFDAAIMRVRDGFIHVENHAGDNQLGGKLIDWDIVTDRLIPAATAQFNLPDLRRGNPQWNAALGKLKYWAEQAKIEVCRTRAPTLLAVDEWCEDADGNLVDFTYTLTPADVEAISRPYIQRTLNLCRKTLSEARLPASAMEQVIMVGGSTLNPWIREAVQAELGRSLEFSIDPVTIVARGAAIYAGTVELETVRGQRPSSPASPGTWLVTTELKLVGNEQDPDVGGRVVAPEGASTGGYTIEFSDFATKWRSGRITLASSGVFMTRLYAATAGQHDFTIELCDPNGTPVPTEPRSIRYTYMINVPTAPPVVENISVGMANGEAKIYIQKGEALPVSLRVKDYISTVRLRAGRAEDVLRIPLLQGEHMRATRNFAIGVMEITGADIPRDLPEGSAVEVTVAMDQSQQITLSVFIERLELDRKLVFNPVSEIGSLERLSREADEQIARLVKVRAEVTRSDAPRTQAVLKRIDSEDLVGRLRKEIAAAECDRGALTALHKLIRDLAALIDNIEDALAWPNLVEEAKDMRKHVEEVVQLSGQETDRRRMRSLEGELQKALEAQDLAMLRRATQAFGELWFAVKDRQPEYHLGRFETLVRHKHEMANPAQADQVIAQGRRAISNGDIEAVKAANRQLTSMLPLDLDKKDMDPRIGGILGR